MNKYKKTQNKRSCKQENIHTTIRASIEEPIPGFFLISHSHGVSLLDGISDWRKQITKNGNYDPRYGAAFQGWFSGSIINEPFSVNVTNEHISINIIQAWVVTPASGIGALAQLSSLDDRATLYINPKFCEVLSSWNGLTPIISMLNGNEHATTMLKWMPSYDFIDSEISELETCVPIIDEVFVDQHIDSWISKIYWPIVAMKKLVQNPVIHILPPPPRQNPDLSRHLEVIADAVIAYGFLSDGLRLKWYKRYCRRLTTTLSSIGCNVLAPPLDACTSSGLLREDFAEGLSHGNSKYGILVAEQLASLVRTL